MTHANNTVTSSPRLAADAARQKYKQLKAIQRTISMNSKSLVGPRGDRAALVAIITWVLLIVIAFLAELAGFIAINGTTISNVVIAGFVAWACEMFTSSLPWSWIELLAEQLAEYDPVHKRNYEGLQEHAASYGDLKIDRVREWLVHEVMALGQASGNGISHGSSAVADFVNKKI